MRISVVLGIVLLVFLASCAPQKQVSENNLEKLAEQSDFVRESMDSAHAETMDFVEPVVIAGNVAKYYEWNTVLFEESVKEGKIIFLDFYASWCPNCRNQAPLIDEGFEKLDTSNVIGFRIPFKDTTTTSEHESLARKYQINVQNTKVLLKDGKIMVKNAEMWSVERFLEEVNKLV